MASLTWVDPPCLVWLEQQPDEEESKKHPWTRMEVLTLASVIVGVASVALYLIKEG